MSTTLPLFWHLSSVAKKPRIEASVKLIRALEQFQVQFVPPSNTQKSDSEVEEDEDDESSDGLDGLNAPDVSYSIRRLVRGLASPRESSRLGFAVALTELLSRSNTVTCSKIISLILNTSKTQGSMSGQEERDVLFARLFGFTAVIQSGLLVRSSTLPNSTSLASSLEAFQQTITELIALGEKKLWLRESSWWTICLAIDALNEASVSWKKKGVDWLVEKVFGEHKTWSPEKVALTLKLKGLFGEYGWDELLAPPFKGGDILASSNLNILAKILKESEAEAEEMKNIPKSAAGAWKPQLHFVWDLIFDQLLPGPNANVHSKGSFGDFYRVVVDESLFSSTSSPERKYWGFQVFQKALPRTTEENMAMLFTKNFMRSWINHLSNNDRYLHKIAKHVAVEIQHCVKNDPKIGFSLILQLTGTNGNQQFDKLTKTKTIESIIASMDSEGIKNYINFLLKQVNSEEDAAKTNTQATKSRRTWIIDQLSALVRNGSIPKNDDWVQSILDWLAVHGLFVMKKASKKSVISALKSVPEPPFSDDLRLNCRSKLLSCLADLTSRTVVLKTENKTTKVTAVASDDNFWISRTLSTIENLMKDSKHVTYVNEADEEERKLWAKAFELLPKLKEISGERRNTARGAELLLGATLMQQFCSDNGNGNDSMVLESCLESTNALFPSEKKQKKIKKSNESSGDGSNTEPKPIDVLLDVVIGFLDKSNAYLRAVGNQTFSLICEEIEQSGVELILTQLERRDVGDNNDEEEDVEMDDEDDEDGSGESEPEGEEKSDEDEGEQSENDNLDDDEADDEEGNEEAAGLREEIRQLLEKLKAKGSGESDASDEESDEELMDDEQMMAIDDQLAEIFKQRKKGKKNADVNAQREATHFKNRVLDLVDIYVKRLPDSKLVLQFISPLTRLVLNSSIDERQLSDKAKGILKSRIGSLKNVPSDFDSDDAAEVFNELHERARKGGTTDSLAMLSKCSLYVSRLLLSVGKDNLVAQTYCDSLTDFVARKSSSLNSAFFQDYIQHHPKSMWSIRTHMLDLSGKAVNGYRLCQLFHSVQVLVNQLSLLGDSQQEIKAFMISLNQTLRKTVEAAAGGAGSLTVPQVREVFKLGLNAVRQTKRLLANEPIPGIWEPSIWRDLHVTLSNSEKFKDSKALLSMSLQLSQTTDQQQDPGDSKRVSKTETAKGQKRKAEKATEESGVNSKAKSLKHKKVKTS